MARLERQESGEVGRWEVPGFIQGCGTQGESRFYLFVSDVNQRNKGAVGLMLIKETKGMERHSLDLPQTV